MRLATVLHPGGTSLAAVSGDGYADLAAHLGTPLAGVDDLCDLLAAEPAVRARLAAVPPPAWHAGEVRVLAPVRRPSKIVCVGLELPRSLPRDGYPRAGLARVLR